MIDLNALPAAVRSRVEWALESAMRDYTGDAEMLALCQTGTDAELIAAGESEYPGAPIGLSTWYGSIEVSQETIFNRVAKNRDRRPVFLRGSKQVLIRKHGLGSTSISPNGWAIVVFWRAVRKAKLTALDAETFNAFADPIKQELRSRYCLTNAFEQHTNGDFLGNGLAIVGGKRACLQQEGIERLRKLKAIIDKTDKLEERREMVRAQLMERLAA